MNSRSRGTLKAIFGVLLAGGALAGILYWNYHPTHVAQASMAFGPQVPVPQVTSPQVAAPQDATSATPPTVSAPASRAMPSMAATQVLTQAHQLAVGGQAVAARKLVNDALVSGAFASEEDASSAKAFLRDLNDRLLFSPERVEGDPYVDVITIKKGDLLMKIANQYLIPHDLILQINNLPSAKRIKIGQQLKVIKGPFHAVVSKSAFTLDVYLGNPGGPESLYVTTFRVGLGTNDSTPTGLWKITPENKLRDPVYYSPRGQGIIPSGSPDNPLGHYWIGLTGVDGQAVGKMSYGIHGTIDPASIGKQSSMGCIRLVNEDVAKVYTMLFEGKSFVRVVE
jgi:lipoprotein-anchoring transpeptidase ErfK/SrfK